MVAVVVNLAVHAGKSRQRQTVCDRAGGLKNFGKSAVCFLVPFRVRGPSLRAHADGIYDVNNQTRNQIIAERLGSAAEVGWRARVRREAESDASHAAVVYAFVARGTTVLAEHTSHSGNFATVAAEVRALLPPFCDVVAFFAFPRRARAAPRTPGATRPRLHPRSPPITSASSARSGARPAKPPADPQNPARPEPSDASQDPREAQVAEEVHAHG